jgi:hypothetical protein
MLKVVQNSGMEYLLISFYTPSEHSNQAVVLFGFHIHGKHFGKTAILSDTSREMTHVTSQ